MGNPGELIHALRAPRQPTLDVGLTMFAIKKPRAVVPRRLWLQDEILSLASSYPAGEAVADISKRLGRTPTAIYGKARRLGLHRPQRHGRAPVADEVVPGQAEIAWPVPATTLDLVPPTPAAPPFAPPVAAPRKPKPFRVTALGGRQTVWSPEMVHRLVLLWVADFHHTTIAQTLDLTACGVASKAVRISLPPRTSATLSKDLAAARRTDAAGGTVPKTITDGEGRQLIGKKCNVNGILFYGARGTHTSVEAKLTLHYDRMRQASH